MHALRIGLTGGIGSGKSTVCHLFEQKNIAVFDADIISRELVMPGMPLLDQMVSLFGNEILDTSGAVNRRYLRDIIFNDTAKKQTLESLLHPAIYHELVRRSQDVSSAYCILAIPLLLETHGQQYVDRILVIDTSIENQLARASQRDQSDKKAIEKIIQQQCSREERLQAADFVIENNAGPEQLEQQVQSLHDTFLLIASQCEHSNSP